MDIDIMNTLGLIQHFLESTHSKSIVFELQKDHLIYFIYRDINEKTDQVVIIKEDWLPLEKRVNWIRQYLLINQEGRINRKTINEWFRENETIEIETTINLKIIDLTVETKKNYKALFFESDNNKKMKFIVEDYLSNKFSISPRVKSNLNHEYRKLIHRGLFNKNKTRKIGVISPFTYGKSALINSLLEIDLLQEDILVKTAKITTITHNEHYWLMKENPTLFIEKYTDDSSFKERLGYLSTINEKGSYFVDTTINNPKLNPITFVDTPGLFGKFPEHDEITEGMIKELHYIIYLLNPTQLGFEPYTKKIVEWQQKYRIPCIFVMNKMDLVRTMEDRIKLNEEFNKTLSQKVEHHGIFYLSAYSALKSRLYKKGKIDLLTLKKDPLIYVKNEDGIISGRSFNQEHVDILEKTSGILQLETLIYTI